MAQRFKGASGELYIAKYYDKEGASGYYKIGGTTVPGGVSGRIAEVNREWRGDTELKKTYKCTDVSASETNAQRTLMDQLGMIKEMPDGETANTKWYYNIKRRTDQQIYACVEKQVI